MNLDVVPRIHAELSSCCVIGAYALAARGYVRQTTDFDLMTTDRRALDDSLWEGLRAEGLRVEVRRGDVDDPLARVVRISAPETSIDLVVAKFKWQQDVIDRSEPIDVEKITLIVPRAADLILLKLYAGGPGDEYDVARLLELGPRDELTRDVDALVASLPGTARQVWERARGAT